MSSSQEEKETLVSDQTQQEKRVIIHDDGDDDGESNTTKSTSMISSKPRPPPSSSTGPIRLKIILLGDQAVGKTSIVARFMYDAFDRNYRATLGVDFLTKRVTVDGQERNLNVWDTAGQERFKSLSSSYIRNSAGCLIVFDISSRESFVNVTSWVEHVRQERGLGDDDDDHNVQDSAVVPGKNKIMFFLVGNKIDLGDKRVVTTEEAETKAKEIGASYCEVSAKSGANIKQLFRKVATTIPLPPQVLSGGGANQDGSSSSNNIGAAGRISGGLNNNNIRRIDPLLVTPARTSDAVANQQGNNNAGGGMCGSC